MRPADPPRRRAAWLLALLLPALAGCAAPARDAPPPQAAAPRPPRDAQPLDQAVASLADATLARAVLPTGSGRRVLVIDPLIDRATGAETRATRRMETQMAALIRARHPRFELRPFTTASLDQRPVVLLGAITTVTAPASLANFTGPGRPPAYRIWAVLADLETGRVLSHETAWVRTEDVDPTPSPFHQASPVWSPDEAAAAYLRTCALDPGDPIDPAYLRTIRVQALVADGIRAQENARSRDALRFFTEARSLAPPDQRLRILNGLYLAQDSLGRRREAEAAFGEAVAYGLDRGRLAVKLVFQPGSTAFWPDPGISGAYPMWLRQIATRTAERPVCLGIEGHTSPTGPPAVNERLSQARAEVVRDRLLARRAALADRLRAEGRGAREPIIGTGADDLSDALDRRVEFEPFACPAALPATAR